MKYTYKDKNINTEAIQNELKISLIANKDDAILNGYINTKQDGDDIIVEIFTYDEDEPANYFEGMYKNIPYNHGHKTSFEKPKEDISQKLTDLGKSKVDDDII